jgi:hypothetical protein
MTKVFIIKYDVHCKLHNFFGKETKVKNCLSEMHAKARLDEYCCKHYIEYSYIIIHECKEECDDFLKMFGDILNPKNTNDKIKDIDDILKNIKK